MLKRIGCILFCLLPLVLTIGLQFLVTIPIFGISALLVLLRNRSLHLSASELYQKCIALWSEQNLSVWISVVYAITALLIFWFWYHKKIADEQEQIPIRLAFNKQIVFGTLLLSIGMQYVTTYLTSFVSVLHPEWMDVYESLMDSVGIETPSLLLILYVCIIAPVSEELIYRGVTFGYAKKALPLIGAICLQAVLFGVFHMNMIQGIYAAFLGLFLGYICEAGGSIVHPILLHIFYNVCGTFVGSYLFYSPEQPFFFLLWLTVGVLLTYAGIFLFQHGVACRDLALPHILASQKSAEAQDPTNSNEFF